MIYVFHHNDIDGHASAVQVKAAFPAKEIRFISCDYTFSLADYAGEICPNDQVFIVDYSFKESTFNELKALMNATENLVWIDHHLCSLELVERHPELVFVAGMLDTRVSGAALTYWFFHKDMPRLPMWIQLVSDYDTWTKEYASTDAFQHGLMASDWSVDSEIWALLSDPVVLQNTIKKGEIILDYIRADYKRHLKEYGFVTDFLGHKCLAINTRIASSMIFDGFRDEYEVYVRFQFTGKCWKYSVYTNGQVNASALASVFGGGGHKCAAGFTTNQLIECFINKND